MKLALALTLISATCLAQVYDTNSVAVQTFAGSGFHGYLGIEYEGSKISEEEGVRKTKALLEKVAASLETGAKFIINSGMIAESISPNFSHYEKNNTYTVGNITMDVTNTYNVDEGYMISNLLYTRGGNKEEHSYKHYVFTLAEVKRLLKLCYF